MNQFKARDLAMLYHAGQKYGDKDYFNYHIQGVVNTLVSCGYTDDNLISVAYLHDILEDTDCNHLTIQTEFGDDIYYSVIALTKNYFGEENIKPYLKRVSLNENATIVKFADMSFNMLNCQKEGEVSRMHRYLANIRILSEFVNGI